MEKVQNLKLLNNEWGKQFFLALKLDLIMDEFCNLENDIIKLFFDYSAFLFKISAIHSNMKSLNDKRSGMFCKKNCSPRGYS
jgi:hypothetical protein